MPQEEQPVHVRTSASASDFWCRRREDERPHQDPPASPLLPSNEDTPYGRQRPPFSPMPPARPVLAPIQVNASREVERAVLCRDLSCADDIERDRDRLQRKVHRLEKQVKSLLQIQTMLTSEMAREYRARQE